MRSEMANVTPLDHDAHVQAWKVRRFVDMFFPVGKTTRVSRADAWWGPIVAQHLNGQWRIDAESESP